MSQDKSLSQSIELDEEEINEILQELDEEENKKPPKSIQLKEEKTESKPKKESKPTNENENKKHHKKEEIKENNKIEEEEMNNSDEESVDLDNYCFNYEFYKNDGELIPYKNKHYSAKSFHELLMSMDRSQRFQLMERKHNYIQWLFPNCIQSDFNRESIPVLPQEIELFRNDIHVGVQYIKNYMMFVEFLGGKVTDLISGHIEAIEDEELRNERFENFENHPHNYLRISRILNSLHVFGFKEYMTSLFTFLDTYKKEFPSCEYSLEKYWKECLLCDCKLNHEPNDIEYKDNVLLDAVKKLIPNNDEKYDVNEILMKIEQELKK